MRFRSVIDAPERETTRCRLAGARGRPGSAAATPCPPYCGASLLHARRQRASRGGASRGSRRDVKSRSQPRLTMQQPIAMPAVQVAQEERPLAEHRALGPVRARARPAPDRRGARPADRSAARRPRGGGRAHAESSLHAWNVSSAAGGASARTTRSSVRLGNCARNSTPALPHGLGELGVVIREKEERLRRGEFLALEQHRRRGAEQQPRGHRAMRRRRRQLVQPAAGRRSSRPGRGSPGR